MLQQQARRAAEICSQLTYFSRSASPGKTRVNLADIVSAAEPPAYSLRKNNITSTFSRPRAAGRRGPASTYAGVSHLVLNAEQAIREPGIAEPCEYAGQRGDSVWASFQMIVPARGRILPNIFDPFYTRSGRRGTGLGLSICKAVMKEHNGSVMLRMPRGGRCHCKVTRGEPRDTPRAWIGESPWESS